MDMEIKKSETPEVINDDEIDLMDLLLVLWKRKWLIICLVSALTLAAFVSTFFMTRIYRAEMCIVLENNQDQNSAKSMIEEGKFTPDIKKEIDEIKEKDTLDFKAKIPKHTNLVKISYLTPYRESAAQVLNVLKDALSQEFEESFIETKQELKREAALNEEEIAAFQNEIKRLENDTEFRKKSTQAEIRKIQEHIVNLKAQIAMKLTHIESLEKHLAYTRELFSKSSELFEKMNNKDNKEDFTDKMKQAREEDLMTFMLMQQKLSNIDNLQRNIVSFENEIIRMKNQIDSLREKITDLNDHIDKEKYDLSVVTDSNRQRKAEAANKIGYLEEKTDKLYGKIAELKNISVLEPPKVSESPVKPDKKMITALAFFASLFLGIFLAFLVEYISNYKNRA